LHGHLPQDLRYSFRACSRSGFTFAAILAGARHRANTAILKRDDGALVRPMPYPEDQNLVIVTTTTRTC
jgi:hypothetical protein